MRTIANVVRIRFTAGSLRRRNRKEAAADKRSIVEVAAGSKNRGGAKNDLPISP
jgi:hypothetical protein